MKKILSKPFLNAGIAIAVTIILLATSFSSTISAQDKNKKENTDDRVSMSYSFEKPIISQTNVGEETYFQISMKNAPSMGSPGEPCLPQYGAQLVLPPGTKPAKIEVTPGEKIVLAQNIRVIPGGECLPLSEIDEPVFPMPNTPLRPSSNTPFTLTPNEAIYCSTTEYPGALFTYVGMQYSHGFAIVFLKLNPVQYIPAHGTLFFYSSLTVKVEVTQDESNLNPLYRGSSKDKNIVQKIVDNPEIVTQYLTQTLDSPLSRDQYDLLILTTDGLRSGFEPLKSAHEVGGVITEIKTLSDIKPNPSEVTPEDIRDFIRNEYVQHGITYVLLGGDNDVVPAKNLFFGYDEGEEYHAPSDLYYACLDGTYNYDNDSYWGEYNDGNGGHDVDLVAEIYVGRACVGSTLEVSNFVQKTISYLTTDPSDEYLKKVLMAGEYLWGPPEYPVTFGDDSMEDLLNESSANGYHTTGIPADSFAISKLYDSRWPGFDLNDPWNTGWPKSEIISCINNNVHIINHLGHGYYDYDLKIDTSDVIQLTNSKYCFIYSQGCMAGGFDQGDCIAEYFTVKNQHGAFAVVMNARYGWGSPGTTDGPSQRYHRTFWNAVFGEGFTTIGAANQHSKEDNIWRINYDRMRWCYYELNLFGDPALDFFGQVADNPPEQPQTPTGEDSGRPNIDYLFSTTTVDPDGDNVYYMWDWGDGNISGWLGPYASGEPCSTTHNWSRIDHYPIRVKARDPWYKTSEWSENLSVNIHIETIHVDDDADPSWYDATHVHTIQEGITNITYSGDIVFVHQGTYHEHITIDATLSLLGENATMTIIDGDGSGTVASITADDVLLQGFTIQQGDQGVIVRADADSTLITGNRIIHNLEQGLLIENAENTTLTDNTFSDNHYGVYITSGARSSSNNRIYHNTFIGNTVHAYDEGANIWDNGYPSGGNYWEGYTGGDTLYGLHQDLPGSDGIGDTFYLLDDHINRDWYPLMNPWSGTSPVPPLTVVYVDDDYNPSTPGWGYKFFNNIQDGIDAVETTGTVFVYEGVYTEQVEVDKTIMLTGENTATTIINSQGTVYAVRITADNVVLSGFTIRNHGTVSQGSLGVMISSNENTITDTIVTESRYQGVYIVGSQNHFSGNTIMNITARAGGILLYGDASSNIIEDNDISDVGYVGIWAVARTDTFTVPRNNTITQNTIYNCSYGIALCGSSGNTITRNTVMNQTFYGPGDGSIGIFVREYYGFVSENNIFTENIIKDNEYCGFLLMDETASIGNNLYLRNTITKSGMGVYNWGSRGNTFRENTITVSGSNPYGPNYGFYFDGDTALNNDIDFSNTVNSVGVLVLSDIASSTPINGLTMEFPQMTYATNYGILNLYNCSHISIQNCTIANNSNNGIYLGRSSNNIITGNTIKGNSFNTADGTYYGIKVVSSSNQNVMYHNNFIGNLHQVYDACMNSWNTSYPAGGNHWGGYSAQDRYHGPAQNLPGADGIGDTPYAIVGGSNYDRYPFLFQEGWLLDYPPYPAYYPSPENRSVDIDLDADLSWTGGDPNIGDAVTYDVYFGTSNPPPLIIHNQTTTTYDPGTLDVWTSYYWRIIAWDTDHTPATGQIWTFRTEDNIHPEWRNQGQTASSIPAGGTITLSAQGRDSIGLDEAWLATNETGEWVNFSESWWQGEWMYSKQIVINHALVPANQTNFPVLIVCTSPDFISHAQSDGDDFAFVDATNTTKYNHEIESYNPATGELTAWVKIPFLSSNQDTTFYLYYGNPSCTNQENTVGTWDSNYLMVNHMTGATSSELTDSTTHHNDITGYGGTPAYNQGGKVGKCVDFDGASTFLRAAGFRLPTDSSYTGSAWVYVDGNAATRRYVFEGDGDYGISLLVWTNESFKNYARSSGGAAACYSTTKVNINAPQWYYVSTRANANSDRLDIFVNGVSQSHTAITGTINPETQGLNIGTYRDNNNFWMNGKIDEIRISNVARSDSWIHTEYNNMISPVTFAVVGEERIQGPGWKYGSPMDFSSSSSNEWVWSNFTWQNPDIPEGTHVGWRIYYFDASGNMIPTDIMSFLVSSVTQVNPPTIPVDATAWHTNANDMNKGICGRGISYTYTTTSTQSSGNIYYTFFWGDGTTTEVGPYTSGAVASASHSWMNVSLGNNNVYVIARIGTQTGSNGPTQVVKMFKLADCNGNGMIDNFDISPFVLAQSGGQTSYYSSFPNGYYYSADCSLDHLVNTFDIHPFVNILCSK